MEYLLALTGGYTLINASTNYTVTNTSNLFNFIIDVILKTEEGEKQDEIVQSIKINLGMTVHKDLCDYCMRKLGDQHKIVKLLNK